MKKLVLLLMLAAAVGTAGAYEYTFSNAWGAGDGSWHNANNWARDFGGGQWLPDQVPGEFDYAYVRDTYHAYVTSAATANLIRVGSWDTAGELTVNGGTLLAKNRLGYSTTTGFTWADGHLEIGLEAGVTGVMTVNSGRVDADHFLLIGNSGTLNMYGGDVYAGLGVTGGPDWDGGIVFNNAANGRINMYGGTIHTLFINSWTTAGTIYFDNADGKIIVNTAWALNPGQALGNMLADGKITAAAGYQVVAELNGSNQIEIYAEFLGTQVTNPLLGYWDFEQGAPVAAGGTTTDKSGVAPAIDLTVQTNGEVVFDADRGNYVLNGRNATTPAAISGNDISKLVMPKVFTLSLWVKPQNNEEQWKGVLRDGNGDANFFNMRTMNSGMLFTRKPFGYEGNFQIWRGNDWAMDGTGPWHHLVISSNGNEWYGYVDGVRYNPQVHGSVMWANLTAPLLFGESTTHLIDDVAIFNGFCPPSSAAGLYTGAYSVYTVPLYEFQRTVPEFTNDYPSDENLIAWYHFEEGTGTTTADLSNPAYFAPADGTLQQGAAFGFDSANKPFQSLTMGSYLDATIYGTSNNDPTGSYVAASGAKYDSTYDFNTTPTTTTGLAETLKEGFSISAWIKPTEGGDWWGTLATKGGYNGMFHFYYENGGLIIQVYTDGFESGDTRRTNSAQGAIVVGEWTHVVATWDPNDTTEEGALYIDGFKQLITNTPTQTTGVLLDQFPARPFMINATGGTQGAVSPEVEEFQTRTFRGQIDDVRLYKGVLTDSQIKSLAYRNCVPRLVGAFDGDCAKVDLSDLAALASDWQAPYTIGDLKTMAEYWLEADVIFPVY